MSKELDFSMFEEDTSSKEQKENDKNINSEELDFSMLEPEEIDSTKKEEVPKSIEEDPEMDPRLNQVLGTVGGAVTGLGLEAASEPVGDYLTGKAEDLAYRAVGGESTPSGRKFLKDEISQIGDIGKGNKITTRSLGRRALDEGYADIFKTTGTAFDQAEENMLESIARKNEILKNISQKEDLKSVSKKMFEDIAPNLDLRLTGEYDEKTLDELAKEIDRLRGSRSLEELEKAKVKTHEITKFDPGTEPISKPKQRVLKSKGKALKEIVEESVAKQGDEVLDQFMDAKRATGERGILRDMLMDKSFRERISPEVSLRDIGMTGVAGPGVAATSKVIQKKGASIGAKLSDTLGKLAKSKATKALPFVGAALGGLATYSEAKAQGLDTKESIGKAISEEGLSSVLGPIAPESIAENQIERVLLKRANGEKLSAEEQNILDNAYKPIDSKKKSPMSGIKSKLDKLNNEQISTMSADMQASSNSGVQSLGKRLEDVNAKEGFDKQQSLWALSQNPAFRKLVEEKSNNKKSIDTVFDLEGGYQNDPDDKGNYIDGQLLGTNHGITPNAYRAFYGETPTSDQMKNLTKEQAEEIYTNDYIKRPKLDLIEDPQLQTAMVDFGVNSGTTKAIKTLQELVGSTPDGLMGPDTIDKINNYEGDIVRDLNNSRRDFIENMQAPSSEKFKKGWQNRIDKMEEMTQNEDPELQQSIENDIDRVNTQQGSGQDIPMSQLDNLMGKINQLNISEEQIDELENDAVNMYSFADGQALKEKIRKLQGLS